MSNHMRLLGNSVSYPANNNNMQHSATIIKAPRHRQTMWEYAPLNVKTKPRDSFHNNHPVSCFSLPLRSSLSPSPTPPPGQTTTLTEETKFNAKKIKYKHRAPPGEVLKIVCNLHLTRTNTAKRTDLHLMLHSQSLQVLSVVTPTPDQLRYLFATGSVYIFVGKLSPATPQSSTGICGRVRCPNLPVWACISSRADRFGK